MKQKYVAFKLTDVDGNITGYNVKYKTNSHQVPSSDYEILIGDDTKFPKAELVDGQWVVTEDASLVTNKLAEDEIATRIKRMEFGRRLIAIIAIKNDLKGLSTEQNLALVAEQAVINTSLVNGAIETAESLISAIVPDEIIITTDDVNAILAEITANKPLLGY